MLHAPLSEFGFSKLANSLVSVMFLELLFISAVWVTWKERRFTQVTGLAAGKFTSAEFDEVSSNTEKVAEFQGGAGSSLLKPWPIGLRLHFDGFI